MMLALGGTEVVMFFKRRPRADHVAPPQALEVQRAWEDSFELAFAIFKFAESIPENDCLDLGGQTRRVALSVPSFIARSRTRTTSREVLRALHQAMSALSELEAYVSLIARLGHASELDARRAQRQVRGVARLIAPAIEQLRAILTASEPASPSSKSVPAGSPGLVRASAADR
jgi:four helix bundle protein